MGLPKVNVFEWSDPPECATAPLWHRCNTLRYTRPLATTEHDAVFRFHSAYALVENGKRGIGLKAAVDKETNHG